MDSILYFIIPSSVTNNISSDIRLYARKNLNDLIVFNIEIKTIMNKEV